MILSSQIKPIDKNSERRKQTWIHKIKSCTRFPLRFMGHEDSNKTKSDLLLLALYKLNESWHQLLINWYILYYAQETKMTRHCGYQNCTTMHFHKALKYWMQYETQMGFSDWPQVLASKFLPYFDFKKIWHLHLKEIYLFIQRWNIVFGTGRTRQQGSDNTVNIPMNDKQQRSTTVTSHEGLPTQPTVQSSCEAWGRYT